MDMKNRGKRARGNILLEFCVGAAVVLLVAGILLHLAVIPTLPAPEVAAAEDDGGKGGRYEALRQQKTDLEKYMEAREDGKDGGKWFAHKDAAEEERECGFTAYISQASGRVYGRVLVGFTRSEDVSVERIVFVADGDERVIPLQNTGRETVTLDGGNVSEIVELAIRDYLPVFRRAAISESVLLRFLGEGETFEAKLTDAQIRNFGRVLRLYEIDREMTEGGD